MTVEHGSDLARGRPLRSRAVDVLAIGDASVDYFVRVPHIARADDKAIGTLLAVHGGGMSANCSAAAAFVGARAGLVAAVGADDEGKEQIEKLRQSGVDTSRTVHLSGARSWFCFVQLDSTGEKALVGVETEAKMPALGDIAEQALQDARVVVPLADDLTWSIDVARRSRTAGAAVAIDLEPSTLRGDRSTVVALLGIANVVFANRATVELISGGDFARCAGWIRQFGPELVILTNGREGAHCFASAGHWAASCDVDMVLDTTGAGDALAGAFLGAWVGGADPATALRAGVAVSSLCVEHVGARTYISAASTEDSKLERRLHSVRLTQEAIE